MKPDSDMLRQALSESGKAMEAIAQFNVRVGFSFGADATHKSAYRNVKDLADVLQEIGHKLNAVCLDTDERLTPKSRM